MKYRKKPIVIEAFQLTKEARQSNVDWPQWLHDAWNKEEHEDGSLSPMSMHENLHKGDGPLAIMTLEGLMKVNFGDYIIQGVKGELYPCKPDIFETTYEPVFDD